MPNSISKLDNIDNELYIQNLEKILEKTHECSIISNFGWGNIFCAIKR